MEIKFELYFLIPFLLHSTKNAESSYLTVKPSTTEAVIGETAIFNCSSGRGSDGIQWFHYPKTNTDRQIVFGFGQIYAAYKTFRIEKNNKTRALNLIIPSVLSTDAGKYECQDEYGRGDKSHAELIVLNTTPVCQSDSDINKVVGENNCGIQPDKLLLSCIVQYYGNERPVLNWKRVGGVDTNGFVFPPTVQGDRVIYNISLSGDSIVNRSSYECFASRGSSPKASCRVGNMTIISKSVSCVECVCKDSSTVVIALVIVFVAIPIVAGATASLVHYLLVYKPKSKLVADTVDGKKYIEAVLLVTLLLLPFYVGILAILVKCLIAHLQKRRQQKNEKTPNTSEKGNAVVVESSAHEESQNLINISKSNQTPNAPDGKKKDPDNEQLNDRKELMREIQEWKEKYGQIITNGSELNKAIDQLHHDKAKLSNTIKDIQSEKEKLDSIIQQLRNENETLKSKVEELEQRLCQADIIDYSEKSTLVHKITTKAHENEKKAITGIAVLEKLLFISHQETKEIEVYDSATYMYVRQLLIPDIGPGPIGISDMASCVKLSCLILIDQFKESSNCSGIRRIDTNGKVLKHWSSGGTAGRLSVYESNVIVCLSDKLEIREFNENGELIQTVRLSPAVGLIHPWHAIKVTSMHFIVSHGELDDKLHRVCLIDLEGKILHECKETVKPKDKPWWPTTLKIPFCLLEDSMRSILVVDREHQRIILLNSSLKWQKKLLDTSEKVTKDKDLLPIRLSFDETGNRLFVAVNKFSSKAWKRGQVLIFNVK